MKNEQANSDAVVELKGRWRDDLMASRDLNDGEKQGYGFLLAWYESWRLARRLAAGADSARQFWPRKRALPSRGFLLV